MAGRIFTRLLRRGPTRDEAFDRFAGPLGVAPAKSANASASVSRERARRSAVSSDVAMREDARAGQRESVRSVPRQREPEPASQAAAASPDAVPAHGRRGTPPPR